MSDETFDNGNQRADQGKETGDLAEGIREVNNQLQQLGQFTQNVASQKLQRELAARAGRPLGAATRKIAMEEASAISRARMLRFARVSPGMAGVVEDVAGAAALGGGSDILALAGGPIGVAALGAAEGAAGTIDYWQGTEQDRRMNEGADQVQRATDKALLDRLAGPDGTASQARDEVIAARADYQARDAREAELREAAKPRWWKLSELPMWAMNKTFNWDVTTREGEKAIEENSKAKERDQKNELRAKAIMKKKFNEEEAPLIEAEEKRNAGDERGAKALEDKVTWMRTYNSLLRDGAEFWQAQQGASAHLSATQQAEQQAREKNDARLTDDGTSNAIQVALNQPGGDGDANAAALGKEAAAADAFFRMKERTSSYARAIDARAGVAETTRVATMAAHETGHSVSNGHALHDELKAMHGTMRDAYIKSNEVAWRAKFTKRTHA
jgi:hypothetical protein